MIKIWRQFMKIKWQYLVASCLVATQWAGAQGSLTPVGPPGKTMKTLQEIEPRAAITNLPFLISEPGSYYFVSNLTLNATGMDGISIAASGVTLDMNGFTLSGPGQNSGHGIVTMTGGQSNLTVRNGVVEKWKGEGRFGVLADGFSHLMERLHVRLSGSGIGAGSYSIIRKCTVTENVSDGITSGILVGVAGVVVDCTASFNRSRFSSCLAIQSVDSSTFSRCVVYGNSGSNDVYGISGLGSSVIKACNVRFNFSTRTTYGILGGAGSVIEGCSSTFNGSQGDVIYGIYADRGGVVKSCSSSQNSCNGPTGYGIFGGHGAKISDCTAFANSSLTNGAGIGVEVGGSIIDCNSSQNARDGIICDSGNIVRGNTCDLNGRLSGDGAGIHVYGVDNRIEANQVTENDRGIQIEMPGNLVIRNSASGNMDDYGSIVATNTVGPIVDNTNILSNNSPHANYRF